jgi:ABC-type branched-subunit amino acid transport system ATPase component
VIETSSPTPILQARDVVAGYEDLTILHGVSLTVLEDQLVLIIGPNGAGKSTLLKVLAGLLPCREGHVEWYASRNEESVDLTRLKTSDRCRLGLGYLPQLDNVFPNMSVLENLKIGAYIQRRRMRSVLADVFEEFPFLYARRRQRAGTLSGGQRKLLALARALVSNPRVLLLDEPSAALAPAAAEEVFAKLVELRSRGLPMLVVEQNARRALALCDYAFVLDMGRNRFEGTGEILLRDDHVVRLYLGQRGSSAGFEDGSSNGAENGE